MSSQILAAQTGWHPVQMRLLNEPDPQVRTLAATAQAEYKSEKLRAYVFFFGVQGKRAPGYPDFGIFVEHMEDVLPKSEVEKFEGPDMSRAAIRYDAIDLSIKRSEYKTSTSTRLLYSSGLTFDTGLETYGFFQTNLRDSKKATLAWRQFLDEMSRGFDEGEAVVGGNVFSHKLVVRFTGGGLGTQLKELMDYCSK